MKKNFWLSLLGTNLLLVFPGFLFFALTLDFSFHTDFFSFQDKNPDVLKFLHLDLFLFLTLFFLLRHKINLRFATAFITIFILFVFIYEVYHYFIFSIVNRQPIVLIDVFQVINLAHLSTELISPAILVSALPILGWLFYKLVRKLVWPIISQLNKPAIAHSFKRFLYVFFAGFIVVVSLMPSQRRRILYKSTLNNVKVSVRASLQELKKAEKFPSVVENRINTLRPLHNEYLKSNEKLNIYLFMIESYGKIFLQSPGYQQKAEEKMSHWQRRLKRAKWHQASKYSVATVKGGNSWVSIGTVLTGIPLHNVIVYADLLDRLDKIPHIVNVLNQNNYTTLSLQPGTRNRLGLKLIDYYNHSRFISFDDLDYQGAAYGVGGMPDQYALAYAHDKFIRHVKRPLFLFFETVSTHAPWAFVPAHLKNYRQLPKKRYGEEVDARSASSYFRLIEYDFEVIVSYIEKHIKENSIVIITGDHQPGFFHWSDDSYEVPLHILVKDSKKKTWLLNEKFSDGLLIKKSTPTTQHEEIYPLVFKLLKQ